MKGSGLKVEFITKRINKDDSKSNIYNQLMYSEDNKYGIFNTQREVFLFAMILGYSKGKKEPLKRKVSFGEGIMSKDEFQNYFKLIALTESNDINVLNTEDKEGIYQKIIEEYANGGIHILEDIVINKKGVIIDNFKELINSFK